MMRFKSVVPAHAHESKPKSYQNFGEEKPENPRPGRASAWIGSSRGATGPETVLSMVGSTKS